VSFTFGSDPEFMLTKDGRFFSAIGVVKGTKSKRIQRNGHEFYYDNVLAECAVKPARNKDEAIKHVGSALKTYAELVSPYRLKCQASLEYPENQLKHRHAFKAGCAEEDCAYTLKTFRTEEDTFKITRLRSAGGHIHIGHEFPQQSLLNCYALARMLDLFVGIPSIFLDQDKTSPLRKKLYGSPGRFRRPEHGLEYRSMGNFWLSSPELVGVIYDLVEFTVEFTANGGDKHFWNVDMAALTDDANWKKKGFSPSKCHKCTAYDVPLLKKAITKMDKSLAAEFMPLIGRYLPRPVFQALSSPPDPVDLYDAWSLSA
jgi:hypothetical protein